MIILSILANYYLPFLCHAWKERAIGGGTLVLYKCNSYIWQLMWFPQSLTNDFHWADRKVFCRSFRPLYSVSPPLRHPVPISRTQKIKEVQALSEMYFEVMNVQMNKKSHQQDKPICLTMHTVCMWICSPPGWHYSSPLLFLYSYLLLILSSFFPYSPFYLELQWADLLHQYLPLAV